MKTHYSYSQTSTWESSIVFSRRVYHGGMILKEYKFHMVGRSKVMGCRIAQDRILLLDGYNVNHRGHKNRNRWKEHGLDKTTLKIEEFREMGYPLCSVGFVVALGKGDKLLMASYGLPPLGAILLRPEGGLLKFIDRSTDNTVKALDVQNRDIVVVGPLDKISQLELGTIQLDASSTPDAVSNAIYNPTSDKSLCIVATISARPSPRIKS